MSKLYIIGNGFDLKHDLPSRYSDFAEFCKTTNWELFEQVQFLFPQITGNSLWSNFEEGLGEVDKNKLYDKFYKKYQKNNKIDMFLKMIENLKERLGKWIKGLNELTGNLQRRYIFIDSDYFVSFNYTNTLEIAYNINSNHILHIHGYAQPDKEEFYAGYIFGHKQPIEKQHEDIDSFDYLYKDLHNELRKEFKMSELKEFITKIKKQTNINHIVVLGHSLNDIDKEYFEEMLRLIPDVSWTIEYFDLFDYTNKQESIRKINIPTKRIEFIKS